MGLVAAVPVLVDLQGGIALVLLELADPVAVVLVLVDLQGAIALVLLELEDPVAVEAATEVQLVRRQGRQAQLQLLFAL